MMKQSLQKQLNAIHSKGRTKSEFETNISNTCNNLTTFVRDLGERVRKEIKDNLDARN